MYTVQQSQTSSDAMIKPKHAPRWMLKLYNFMPLKKGRYFALNKYKAVDFGLIDQIAVDTHGWLLTCYGQEGDNNCFHGSISGSNIKYPFMLVKDYDQKLLQRLALRFSMHKTQAHLQW